MKSVRFLAVTVLLASPVLAEAQGLPIEPGLWETTITQNNPFLGTKTETKQDCVQETEFDPRKMLEGAEGCTMEQDISGNTLTFSMQCNNEDAAGSGSGKMTSNGDTGSGEMQMQWTAGGQTMSMEMEWNGKRIGDC